MCLNHTNCYQIISICRRRDQNDGWVTSVKENPRDCLIYSFEASAYKDYSKKNERATICYDHTGYIVKNYEHVQNEVTMIEILFETIKKSNILRPFIFLIPTLKQSIFGPLIPKPYVKWLFVSFTLIIVKKHLAGLNTLRNPNELEEPNLDKINGVCVCSQDPYGNFLKKFITYIAKNCLENNWE